MRQPDQPSRRKWPRARRTGLTAATSSMLGTAVAAAVPLQRRHPAFVLALSLAELAAFVALILTASLAALIVLAALSAALMALVATNRHRILAVTPAGIVLAASTNGRPLVPIGPAPDNLALPPPAGVGVAVELSGTIWWVDRSAFARLRSARELLGRGEQ